MIYLYILHPLNIFTEFYGHSEVSQTGTQFSKNLQPCREEERAKGKMMKLQGCSNWSWRVARAGFWCGGWGPGGGERWGPCRLSELFTLSTAQRTRERAWFERMTLWTAPLCHLIAEWLLVVSWTIWGPSTHCSEDAPSQQVRLPRHSWWKSCWAI